MSAVGQVLLSGASLGVSPRDGVAVRASLVRSIDRGLFILAAPPHAPPPGVERGVPGMLTYCRLSWWATVSSGPCIPPGFDALERYG